ncbi:mental retardation GTPase activating protein homolog 4 [Abrus precatorius]|uniref:Mental retardation GTPase activating protein homolog 4 n=1 Tax=Abrus precatorius TaxID=3816 RepID=A0A8B8MIC3_ABRPR|nr:mental retardation GTPase activating protein homolog 4 [Abrus precatorius]
MVSLEPVQGNPRSSDAPSSPRISFSAEFLDENNFISISPNSEYEKDQEKERERARNADFEFLSSNVSNNNTVLTADELFFEGKLLPFWQMQHLEKLNKISLKAKDGEEEEEEEEEEVVSNKEDNSRVNWFVDDDPSPRPPKCTVLWKELLRLKKQRASSLSPSSSSSSSSSCASSLGDVAAKEGKEGSRNKEQQTKRVKKGLERTRSATIRIRPMINVPICTQVKSSALPPLFPLKKGKLER